MSLPVTSLLTASVLLAFPALAAAEAPFPTSGPPYLLDVIEQLPPNQDDAGSHPMDAIWAIGHGEAWSECLVYDPVTGEPTIDAGCFLDAVIERYRALAYYRDRAHVVRITTPSEGPPSRVETRIDGTVVDGEVSVRTPTEQLGGALTRRLRWRTTPQLDAARRDFDVWLAPHLALTQATTKPRPDATAPTPTDPARRQLSVGAGRDVSVTAADAVVIDDRSLVHLELNDDAAGDGASTSRLDVYVDPESLLVERVENHERSHDGAGTTTTYDIETIVAESGPPPAREIDPVGDRTAGGDDTDAAPSTVTDDGTPATAEPPVRGFGGAEPPVG